MAQGQTDSLNFQLKYRDAIKTALADKAVVKMLKVKTYFAGVQMSNDNLIMLYLTALDSKGFDCLTKRLWNIVVNKGKKYRVNALTNQQIVAKLSWEDINKVYEELSGIRNDEATQIHTLNYTLSIGSGVALFDY